MRKTIAEKILLSIIAVILGAVVLFAAHQIYHRFVSSNLNAGLVKKEYTGFAQKLEMPDNYDQYMERHTPAVPEGMARSQVTGDWIDETIVNRRPVAIMLSNIQTACPQTGISRAGVVYEAPVEGGITRLMGIFEEYDDLEKIGSVRSCRNYYVYYAAAFDAVYAHFGQAVYAEGILASSNIDNLSGLEGIGSTVYYRTSDRVAPHNAYASGAGLAAGIEQKGYRTDYAEGHTPHYQFAEEDQILESGEDVTTVTPGYQINQPWFEYSAEEGVYYRYQYGSPQIDDMDNTHLAYKNIILQYTATSMYDQSYLNIDISYSGSGKYITNGKAIDITWQRESEWGKTRYYDADGNEIELNPGKTWVCIVSESRTDQVSLTN